MSFSRYIPFLITVLFYSCSNTEQPKDSIKSEIKEQAEHIEAIPVEHFNDTPPFFSTLKNQAMKWNTIMEQDTLKKFEYKNSYIAAVNDQIVKCKIIDNDIAINHGIHTGITKSEFHKYFTNLKDNHTASKGMPLVKIDTDEVYISCCENGSQYWRFKFQNDTLKQIDYYQYQ